MMGEQLEFYTGEKGGMYIKSVWGGGYLGLKEEDKVRRGPLQSHIAFAGLYRGLDWTGRARHHGKEASALDRQLSRRFDPGGPSGPYTATPRDADELSGLSDLRPWRGPGLGRHASRPPFLRGSPPSLWPFALLTMLCWRSLTSRRTTARLPRCSTPSPAASRTVEPVGVGLSRT